MALLTKEVEVSLISTTIKYYEGLGYNIPRRKDKKGRMKVQNGTKITIKANDLKPNSEVIVSYKCDYCGTHKDIIYRDYFRMKNNSVIKKDCCYECRHLKKKESDLVNYGVEHTTQLNSTKEKMKETMLNKYGKEFPSQVSEIKEKMIQTTIENYGVENSMMSQIVREKVKKTMLINHGVEYPMQSEAIREKINKTRYKNGNIPCSNQQMYLHKLLGGLLNYPIKSYSLDIAFIDENLYLEYDGSGHRLQVILGAITEEEMNKKEIKRNYTLSYYGWNRIRIVSSRDYLPNNETIFRMIQFAKKYLNEGHSWIKFDIDNSKVVCSQFEQDYDFGVLRKIKEKDLEEVV